MSKLSKQSFFNYYVIFNRKVSCIHFFDKSGIVLTYKKGWFGNNYESVPSIESLEFKHVRKADTHLKNELPFAVNAGYDLNEAAIAIYIPISLVDFKDLGEEIALELDHETCYGHFFMLDGKRWMLPTYTRCVPTESGALTDKIEKLIDDATYRHGGIVNIDKFITETLPKINELAKGYKS